MPTLNAAGQVSRIGARRRAASAQVAGLSQSQRGRVTVVRIGPSLVEADWIALAILFDRLNHDGAAEIVVLTGASAFSDVAGDGLAALREAVASCAAPVVAAIPGAAFGTGLALALACRFRVAAADARFAFPAIRRAQLPDARSIQRLARTVPLPHAADLLAFGCTMAAAAARDCGLIDHVASVDLEEATIDFAVAQALRPRLRPSAPATPRHEFAELGAQASRRASGQLAPLAAIEALRHALRLPGERAYAEIARVVGDLDRSDQAAAVKYAEAAEFEALRGPPLDATHDVRSVCLLGLGAARVGLARMLARIGILEAPADSADLVVAAPGAALPLATDPARVVVARFYAPGGLVRLAEAAAPNRVPGGGRALAALAHRIGLPFIRSSTDDAGALVDRLRWPFVREAIHLLDEGATPRQIDRALLAFGLRTALFAALDHEGLEAFVAACIDTQGGAAWRHYSPTIDLMLDAARSGVSAGRGWYRYASGSRTPLDDPDLDRLLRDAALAQRLPRVAPSDADIVERCLLAAINQAAGLMEAAQADARTIDAIWTGILAFPRWRGGLLRHADGLGLAAVAAAIRRAQEKRGTLGPPAALLLARAADGGRLTPE